MNIKELKAAKTGGVLFLTLFLGIRRIFIRKKYGREEASNQKSADLQSIERVVIRKLRKKYFQKTQELKKEIDENYNMIEHHKGDNIWILWLQGFENAPEIVKICYNSVIKNKPKHMNVVLLDEKNLNSYVKLPTYINSLYEKGYMTFQTYSDLVRLELLTTYGGTWIDATVLISSRNYPDYIFDSKLFLYQNLFPATWGMASVMNSWFITSESGEKILELTKRLMLEYYKTNKYTCDYWLIYDFFELAIEQYRDEFLAIIPQSVEDTHVLQSKLVGKYDKRIYDEALRISSIHKLQWRFSQDDLLLGDTTYKHLKSDFGEDL